MDVLTVSPTGSGVKNVITSIGSTEAWEEVDTSHLTLSIHDMDYDCSQISILSEKLLDCFSTSSQFAYLIYGILWFWIRAYVYTWVHHDEYDLIWLHNPRLLALLPSKLDEKIVVTYHGPLQKNRASSKPYPGSIYHTVMGRIEWLGIRRHRDASFTGVSEVTVKSVQSFGVAANNTSFVGNGVDIDQFSPGNPDLTQISWEDSDATTILYVGRLEPEKGILELISTFETLTEMMNENTLRLVIVGDGTLRSEIESQTLKTNSINFVGYIPHSNIVHAYRSADCLALPSKFEGASIPLSLSEGFACGLPAFISAIPTLRKVADEEFAVPIEFESPEEAATTIHHYLNNQDDLEHLGMQARDFAEEHLSWEQMAEDYLDIFSRRIRNNRLR